MNLAMVEETKSEECSWRGIAAENGNAWLTKMGYPTLLNNKDILYIRKREYLDGPDPKDMKFFKKFQVVAVYDLYNLELLAFAPQCKYRWQVWWFKCIFCRYIKRNKCVGLWQGYYEQTLSLVDFLWKNNPNRSHWF